MQCRATQDRRVMVESSAKCGTREGNGKPLQYSCIEKPMNSMKRQKDESQFLGRLIRSPEAPKETGVWNSQGGGKDKLFFFLSAFLSLSHIKQFCCCCCCCCCCFSSSSLELMIIQLSLNSVLGII